MLTGLDLLVIVFMVMVSVGLLAICIMLLARNAKLKKICFYITAGLSLYAAYAGVQVGWPIFVPKVIIAAALGLVSVLAVVLEWKSGKDDKKKRLAHFLVAAALIAGVINTFM